MKERTPYKYLDYYTFEDADIFFGREAETQKLVGEILSTRLLVLFSPSGSGKTSLIHAGVRPTLEKLGYRTVYTRLDENDPITSVQQAVSRTLGISEIKPNGDLHAFITNALHNQQRATSDKHQASNTQPLVIFIDQFEEFFLVWENQPEARQAFIQQVAKIKYDDKLPVFIVLSLREDYFANLHEFRDAIPSIFQNNANIRLQPFSDDEAKRAIAEPVKEFGVKFQEDLVDTLVRDLKNGKTGIEPIALQIVCHTLWQNKPKTAAQLDTSTYKKCRGTDAILSEHVDKLLRQIPVLEQGLMVRIFEALKTRDNTKLYRRLHDLQEALRTKESRLKNALQKLAALGVLRHEQRQGDDWYEFKHDYLVPEVIKWIQARRERIYRNSLIYAVSPAILFALMLFGYLFYEFNTFYLRFSEYDYEKQEAEIIITRGKPFQRVGVISTGYLESDLLDSPRVNDAIEGGYKIGLWQIENWQPLADKLELVIGAKFLYGIGEKQAGIDTLVAALKDHNYIQKQASTALIELGQSDERVIGTLVAALKSENRNVRAEAACVLVKIGQSDVQVIDELLDALKSSDYELKVNAAGALGEIKSTDARVIDGLLAVLEYYDMDVLVEAVTALANLGQSDDRWVGELLAALKNQDPFIRIKATRALGEIMPTDERVIDGLLVALKDPEDIVREHAADALGEIKSMDQQVISGLLAAMKANDSSLRVHAASALGKIKPTDERVIDALLAALKDWNTDLRTQVVDALIKLGQSDERVIGTLVAALKNKNIRVRAEVASVLGEIKSTDERVIGGLLAALEDPDDFVQGHAMEALGEIESMDERVINRLLAALKKDERQYLRAQAAASLGNIKSSGAPVIDALSVALKDQNKHVRREAAGALVKLGQNDEQVIDELLVALKDQDESGRERAARALGQIKTTNLRVIGSLLVVLQDPDSFVRAQSAGALGEIMSSDDRVFGALVAALKDRDRDVRKQAATALIKLQRNKLLSQLLTQLAHPLSGFRTAAAQALAQKVIPIDSTLQVIAKLKQDDRPWVRLGAWEAYELLEKRREAEKQASGFLNKADSLFGSNQLSVTSGQYESAFYANPKITHGDSVNAARAKFQQARCAALLKQKIDALDALKIAFEYNDTLKDTLTAEMSQSKNDWAILQGNWYLRDVLLKKKAE